MPDSKHTPGEWLVDRGFYDAMFNGEHTTYDNDFLDTLMDEDGDTSDPLKNNWAQVYGPNQEANARLIAAAPDLLSLCLLARDIVSGFIDFIENEVDIVNDKQNGYIDFDKEREFLHDIEQAISKAEVE